MTAADRAVLEDQIAHWRSFLNRRRAIDQRDVEELESHLRDQVDVLADAGLAGDEAFLVAVKRMGNLDALSREFAREHSERLWKQLVISGDSGAVRESSVSAEALVAVGLALVAALAVKLPSLLGVPLTDDTAPFYGRNLSLLVLPPLVVYFGWKRRLALATWVRLAVTFSIAAVVANTFPFGRTQTLETLTALHLPIALWFAVGLAYVGGRWFAGHGRMNFVRYTGELVIYYALIALGGFVLTGFTIMMFQSIGLDVEWLAERWLVPCGAAGAILIGSWLVEAKQSVIENMAPVLTRLFTPLFSAVLVLFLGTMLWTGHPIDVKREVLIAFDLLLVLVVGLVLYAISARDPLAPVNLFDRLQLVLVITALVVDGLALTAIASRISEFGSTPNRVAALGENLILLANLAGTAWYYAQFLRRRTSLASLERWQLTFLPVYSAWAALVVITFPLIFAPQ